VQDAGIFSGGRDGVISKVVSLKPCLLKKGSFNNSLAPRVAGGFW
jgi:hypothetical protein